MSPFVPVGWVMFVLTLLNLNPIDAEEDPQAEFVKKWRNFNTITVELLEYNERELVKHQATLSENNVKQMETCFNDTYNAKAIPREHYVDVDQVLHAYGKCLYKNAFATKLGTEYKTLTAEQASILVRKYRAFDLEVTLGDVRNFPMDTRPPQPKTVMTKWIHNYGDSSVESSISESIEAEDTATNTMTHAAGFSVTASAEFDFVVSVSTSVSTGYSHTWNDATTTKTVKTFSISDTVTVPAKTSAEVTWLLTEQDFKMRWEAPMYISGAISIQAKKDGVEKMYFLPVTDMPRFFNDIQEADESKVFIVLKGIIQGKKNIGSSLQVKEKAISESDSGPCSII